MLKVEGYQTKDLTDSRSALERLSRQSLYYLLVANGVKCKDDMPKTRLLTIAELDRDKLVIEGPDGTFAYNKVQAYKDPKDNSIRIIRPACTISAAPDELVVEGEPEDKPAPKGKKSKKEEPQESEAE